MAATFWEIIKESKIEIPEIQRDYAQGRLNDRVNAIRKGFVSDLLDAIDNGKSLNLDFIFGQSVDKTNQANFNKSKYNLEQMLQVLEKYSLETGVNFESKIDPKPVTTSEDKLLIPFDGQQRLTTLFLLHVYIGVMAEKDISFLNYFDYKTRESSTQFIREILRNSNEILHFKRDVKNGIKLLSEGIKNQSWFFSSWIKDPTVSGMLVTLDEIRKQSLEKEVDVEKAWINLTEKKYIKFDYFDIQEEGFDEDLYVKMNARGKGLTDFENFRAWLEKKYKGVFDDEGWITKLDKAWMDLFWETKEKVKDVDDNYLAFFKNMSLLNKVGEGVLNSDNNYASEKKLIELLKPSKFTPTSDYEEENIFNETSLKFIFKILDVLTSDKDDELNSVVNKIWNKTFKGKMRMSFTNLLLTKFDDLNLYHKTFFFSILKFLDLQEKTDITQYTKEDWDKLKGWIRISRNVIYNSRIDDNTAYVPAIYAITKLGKGKILNIKNELSKISEQDDKGRWISFFNKSQQKEECKKAVFLCSQENQVKWSELIINAENHFYFYGQIGFIFKLSKDDVLEFEKYFSKVSKLFAEDNINSEQYLLQRLFFAFDESGTWLKNEGTHRFKFYKSSSGTSRERDENWRHLFNDSEKRTKLKSLLDDNTIDLSNIDAYIDQQRDIITDWRKLILDKPGVLKHCQHGVFKKESESNIRLLTKTLPFSTQRELRSYYFYLRQNKEDVNPFEKLRYYSVSKQNERPCAYYDKWIYKDVSYFMDCFFLEEGYSLLFSRRIDGKIDEEIKSLLLDNFEFQEQHDELVLYSMSYDELLKKLEEILLSLSKFESKSTNIA